MKLGKNFLLKILQCRDDTALVTGYERQEIRCHRQEIKKIRQTHSNPIHHSNPSIGMAVMYGIAVFGIPCL